MTGLHSKISEKRYLSTEYNQRYIMTLNRESQGQGHRLTKDAVQENSSRSFMHARYRSLSELKTKLNTKVNQIMTDGLAERLSDYYNV